MNSSALPLPLTADTLHHMAQLLPTRRTLWMDKAPIQRQCSWQQHLAWINDLPWHATAPPADTPALLIQLLQQLLHACQPDGRTAAAQQAMDQIAVWYALLLYGLALQQQHPMPRHAWHMSHQAARRLLTHGIHKSGCLNPYLQLLLLTTCAPLGLRPRDRQCLISVLPAAAKLTCLCSSRQEQDTAGFIIQPDTDLPTSTAPAHADDVRLDTTRLCQQLTTCINPSPDAMATPFDGLPIALLVHMHSHWQGIQSRHQQRRQRHERRDWQLGFQHICHASAGNIQQATLLDVSAQGCRLRWSRTGTPPEPGLLLCPPSPLSPLYQVCWTRSGPLGYESGIQQLAPRCWRCQFRPQQGACIPCLLLPLHMGTEGYALICSPLFDLSLQRGSLIWQQHTLPIRLLPRRVQHYDYSLHPVHPGSSLGHAELLLRSHTLAA